MILMTDEQFYATEPDMVALHTASALRETDFAAAKVELEKLSSRGSTMAMLYLGYSLAERGPEYFPESIKWYQAAFDNGSSRALLALANISYKKGEFDKAGDLWRLGVKENDAASMYYLALSILAHAKSIQEIDEAKLLLWSASDNGQVRAKLKLSLMYFAGNFGVFQLPRGISLFFEFLIESLLTAKKDPYSYKLW